MVKNIKSKDLSNDDKANALLKDFPNIKDPKYVGPGTWNVIHSVAFNSKTKDERLIFISLMKQICYKFPCFNCKEHCTKYIKDHPLEEYLNKTIEINGKKYFLGLFVWTWKFHNNVNERLNKPIMTWDTAYNLYSSEDSLMCSKSCLESK